MSDAQLYHLLIADDHPLFRGALREAVNGLFERIEVAEAGAFEEVVERLEHGSEHTVEQRVGGHAHVFARPISELAGCCRVGQ